MRLLIDGVFFQLAETGISRIWRSILPALAARQDIDMFILDRGGVPAVDQATRIPFPAYKDLYTADDSELIQRVCDTYLIDVFTSTYYTTPLTIPMFVIIYDMIPELLGFDLADRHWQEKAVAISYSARHICISQRTREDLLLRYPTLDSPIVSYPGVDRSVFHPVENNVVKTFRASLGFDLRPYVVTVGSREQHLGYKNGRLLFDAMAALDFDGFDILCIGGEPEIEADLIRALPSAVKVKRIAVNDFDLATALSGAAGLIYPSLYEGFGLPVLEAMACGCPVVTTSHGSLPEVTGDACAIIGGSSRAEMVAALGRLASETASVDMRRAGLERAAMFDWSAMVSAVATMANETAKLAGDENYQQFAAKWKALRRIQAMVDVDRWSPPARP